MPRRYVKILTGIAIVLVALGVLYAAWVGFSTAKLQRAYAALEKDGRPMHVADVIPPEVPELENAALLYESAALLLKATPAPWESPSDSAPISTEQVIKRDRLKDILGCLGDLSKRFVEESLDRDEQRQLEELFQQDVVTTALWAVEEGTNRPSCRFDRDYEAGMGMRMSNLLDTQNLCRILGAKACVEAETDDGNTAWRFPLIQLRFAHSLRVEPTLIDQMVAMGMVSFSCRTIQKLCAIATPPDHYHDDLSELLSQHEDVSPLVRALDGERLLFGEWVFTRPIDEVHQMGPIIPAEAYMPELIQRAMLYRISFRPFLLADHATYLNLMRQTAQLWEEPYSSEKTEALERKIEKAKRHNLLTDMLLPATGGIRRVHTLMATDIHITQTGLALIQYRQNHGSFPETLNALGPSNVQDPFSGATLGYKRDGAGFVVYSVGTDRADNGGAPRQSKQNTGYDIAWHFPGPPTR